MNNTQTNPTLHMANPNNTNPLNPSSKYTNTYKPTYNNNTQTDPILQSTKYPTYITLNIIILKQIL